MPGAQLGRFGEHKDTELFDPLDRVLGGLHLQLDVRQVELMHAAREHHAGLVADNNNRGGIEVEGRRRFDSAVAVDGHAFCALEYVDGGTLSHAFFGRRMVE